MVNVSTPRKQDGDRCLPSAAPCGEALAAVSEPGRGRGVSSGPATATPPGRAGTTHGNGMADFTMKIVSNKMGG
ncbi:hypothetical protein FHX34_103789 [Actinoplanes teichomyceticus]|uniref:Uncharacterized protein n=1 Tax=Actinoplanes teichomyceticus TaxID=1867 RepID=A0A561WBL5_ACTTI|nr:hypothetical protein FHX34_103789 [Actinoplanes teichomyceticus]